MSEFEFAKGLPSENELPTDEMEKVTDALVPDTSGLKVKIPSVADLSELIPGTNLKRFKLNRPCPPLEQYVAEQVGVVKMMVATGQLSNPVHEGEDRVARAERYARWRWHGYRDGEIASL